MSTQYSSLQFFVTLLIVFVAHVLLVNAYPNHVDVKASLKPGWKYTVQSPGFPNNYPPDISYTWNITGPDGYELWLVVNHFQIEPSDKCDKDYLLISFSNNSLPLRNKHCSILSDNYIQSLTWKQRAHTWLLIRQVFFSNMWLQFKSDGSSQFKGFRGEIRLVAPIENNHCKNYLNDTSGSFTSPKYPKLYPTGHSCTWHIAVPDGMKVKLKFIAFDLENTKNKNDDCINDYVEIREGIWGRYGEILGRFCGDAIPPDVTSPSNQMWFRFVSDGNSHTVYKGFSAAFLVSGSSILTSYTTFFWGVLLVTTWL